MMLAGLLDERPSCYHERVVHAMRSAVIALVFVAGCGNARRDQGPESADGGPCQIGRLQSWPEADRLFAGDEAWMGADAAYSVDLGGGRVLWLFGDSFVAKTPVRARADAWFLRNSVGIQSGGADPSSAQMKFAWRDDAGQASSFFPERDGHWFWPLGGVRLPSRLVLFLLEEERIATGLGFQSVGTRV